MEHCSSPNCTEPRPPPSLIPPPPHTHPPSHTHTYTHTHTHIHPPTHPQRQLTPLLSALRNVTAAGGATVKLLVSRGADCCGCVPDTRLTPLMEACLRAHESGVRTLLRGGADARSLDAEGRSALHWAAQGGSAGLLAALDTFTGGTLRDSTDLSGYTPLMYAAESGHADCVRALLAAGADMQQRNANGHRAAELAEWYGHKEVRAALEAAVAARASPVAAAAGRLAGGDAPVLTQLPQAVTPPGPGTVAAAMEGLSLRGR